MSYFDRNPNVFRILVSVLAAIVLTISAMMFYRYGSLPTDENWFRQAPSKLCFVLSVDAGTDTIRPGDLLTEVGNHPTRRMADLEQSLSSVPPDSVIRIAVFRPETGKKTTTSLRRRDLPEHCVRELPTAAYVFYVIKDGASDRAGMRAGDLIVRINGQTFASVPEADRILRGGQIGKTIEYVVIRENQEVPLLVTLASFGFPFPHLIMFTCGLAYMAFGAFVALKQPKLIPARLLGTAFLALGFSVATALLSRGLGPTELMLLRNFAIVPAYFFGFALMFHSHHYFPKERHDLLRRRWIRMTIYVLALIGTLGFVALREVWLLIGLSMMVLFVTLVRILYRKTASEEYKKLSGIIKWVGIGVALGTSIVLAVVFTTGSPNEGTIGYIGAVLILIPLSYAYTIGRYRLLDMDLRVRRNVQYSFAAVAWLSLSVLLLLFILFFLPHIHLPLPTMRLTGGSLEIVDAPMTPEQRTVAEKSVLMVFAIGLAFFFRTIGRGGQEILAKKFHRAKYDYRRAANELAEVMAATLNMTDLARSIAAKLAELMHLRRAGVLFFRQQKMCCCQEAFGFNGKEWEAFCLSLNSRIPESITRFKGEFSVEYFPSPEKESFLSHGFHLVIPIRSKEKLVGALLLGEKLSESPFQHEDFEFLSAAANQASVAIENAFLYEELAEQERLKRELEIARRIQLESLPQTTPTVPGLELSGVSIPAKEVGGDYFDYLNGSSAKLTVIVGDVSGKGTPAALYMSKVQGIMRSLHGFNLSPKDLFIRVNILLCNDLEKKSFVTAIGAFFDTSARQLVLARAGHLPLFMYHRGTKTVERVLPRGIGFGLSADDVFATELEERVLRYEPGDVFLFVTDGVTEARRGNGEQYGEENLSTLLRTISHESAEKIRDTVVASVHQFTGNGSQEDDQTVVIVKAI